MGPTRSKLAGVLLLTALCAALVGSTWRRQDQALKVCADPDNLPFSNEQQEGFENKIAQLVARELGSSLVNFWWPHRRGFVRNTLRAGLCDVIIGVPKGFDPVLTTNPYYRSTYHFVYRQDRQLDIRSLDDTILRHLKIGVNLIGYDYTNTPPAHALSAHGVVGNLVGFPTFYTKWADRPNDIIDAVAKGTVDVAIVWGPLAGYFAKREPVPLTLVALPDSDMASGMPFAFDVAMGVRRSDRALGARIDSVLERQHGAILRILQEYDVPVIGEGRDTVRDSLLATEAEYQGWKWFHVYCYRCHGTDAFGGQLAPDLRRSLSSEGSVTHDAWMVIVREGLVTKGMPAWNVLLTDKQIEDLYAYTKARSDGRLAPGRPHKAEQ